MLVDIVCKVTSDIVVTIDSKFSPDEIETMIKKGTITVPYTIGNLSTYYTDNGSEVVGVVVDISGIEIEPVVVENT